MKTELTVSELRHLTAGTPFGAGLEYLLAQSHQDRLSAVQTGVDFACNFLERDKHKKQGDNGKGMSEDEITVEICEMLSMVGFQAAHDEQIGGHCDIVIKGKHSFLWLAEAKKHDSYGWLDRGYKQLSTRYSTGVSGQDNGEILVYCYSQDALAMLTKWRQELTARNPDVSTINIDHNPLTFCSKHKHTASGLDFHVRHKAIALHWNPSDIS